ncbi:MAG: non-heme iron oxygenase ferredoxin subunit [Anaerolineaceae bacterium]|nr:MAG: non-heme iron oxygenase ferredoxin subunit [Anaerolineaceae bacterium]
MSDFITIGTLDELSPGGEPIVVDINRRWVAVYNIDGNYYAIEDRCTHDDGPLAEGELNGCIVTCPRHGARFDVTSGEALSGPAGTINVPTYDVRVVGDEIQISTKRKTS